MTGFWRKLRRDERGNSPLLVMAGAAIFAIVSVGLAAGLTSGLLSSAAFGNNTSLEEAAAAEVRAQAMKGYTAVATLPASQEITLTVNGSTTVRALRQVQHDGYFRTARVTITAGKSNGIEFAAYSTCATSPQSCVIATQFITDVGTGTP